MKTGQIIIAAGRVVVVTEGDGMKVGSCFETVTQETVFEAARILADRLNVPHADPKKEAQRIHRRDQRGAAIDEAMDEVLRED